jgi:hypothetical protein
LAAATLALIPAAITQAAATMANIFIALEKRFESAPTLSLIIMAESLDDRPAARNSKEDSKAGGVVPLTLFKDAFEDVLTSVLCITVFWELH